ncbi:MAG: hypothetical protein WDW36_010350 [Sanguina aurantia]
MSTESALKVIKNVAERLNSIGVKPPWRYTGTWSLPTYLHYTASGLDYKKFSPGSPPIKAIVPHTPPKMVYDIKYYVRDFRRNNTYSASKIETNKPFDFAAMYAKAPLTPADVAGPETMVLRPPTMPTRGY